MRMKRLLFILFGSTLLLLQAEAQIITANSCSSSDVQNAFDQVTSSTTSVNIPPGTCHWSTTVTLNVPSNSASLSVVGAGSQNTLGGGDATVIIDDMPRGPDNPDLQINTVFGGFFRLTGITFQTGTGGTTFHGMLHISGETIHLRVDHIHLMTTATAMQIDDAMGVMDHSLVEMGANSTNNGIHFDTPNAGGHQFGDGIWAQPTGLGTSDFMFVEDSTFNNGFANDCGNGGGKFVFRHNTMNSTQLQTHPTGGGGRLRGCRAWEIYDNNYTGSNSNSIFNAFYLSNGTGVFWGNSAPTGYQSMISGHVDLVNNQVYLQQSVPNGWGYCGSSSGLSGASSSWDGNADSTGYACLDQIGRGQGDLLANTFPNAINMTTNGQNWPHQAQEPVYEWLDTWNPVPGFTRGFWNEFEPLAQENRDYYLFTTTFDGSSGVGSGLLSARPSMCTPAVAFWATDTKTLYQCSAANTWTKYYTPFTYPHPLTTGATPPAPPTNVSAVAK